MFEYDNDVSLILRRKIMKKILFTLLVTMVSAGMAHAQVNGGFEGPSAVANTSITVQEALTLNEDAKVTLTGQIINSLGDEKYTFKDATGEIIIEIDDEDWNGEKVTPENTVEISGEIDKDVNEPVKIDVDTFRVK